MKNIKVSTVYMHQGQKMSPKLVYAVPDAVADGLVSLGLAALSNDDADLSLDGLTWDSGTVRHDAVVPDIIISDQK